MTTSQSNIKGGIRLQCETSQNPAPRPQSSYPIPNFPSAETSLISLSVYASTGLGNEGILVSPAGTLPGSATATWTLFHQYYQGTPAVLPTPDALALVVSGGTFTGQPFPNALNGAIHLFWLQSIDGTKTTVFPACEITTSLDPTQGTLAGLVTSLGTIEGDIAAMATGTQLTPAQMALAQADYHGLLADQTSIQAQATSAGLPTSSYTALAVAMTALETYLTGLPNWVSATLNTTIVPGPVTTSGTWLYEWNAATSAMSALETVIASAIATSITGLSTTIDAMATTSQLSTAQQATAWQDWLALLQDQASAVSQCAAVGLPASTYATLATDMTALLAYLTGLGISGTPTGNITIVPGPVTTAGTWLYTWNKVFTDFNTVESAITTAVTTICTLSGSAATFTVGISATAASFSGNATIGTSGNRQITLLSGTGAIEIQAAPGGWAEGLFINNNAQSAIIGGFGVYGAGDVIGYHYLGATYNAPLFKVDQFGNGTFVGNVTGRVKNAESGISAIGTMICSVDNNGTASLASQDTPGYVRIGGSASDLPSGAGPYGNLNNIYGGSDTITQVYYNYLTPDMWLRSANYASGAWQWNGGGWAKIYTTSNIITSLNSMMAITGMSNIPVIVMGTSLPATTNYPLNSWIFMPQITAYGAQGSMYQNVSGSWANAQAGYQTIGAVAAGSISAGALSAYVALIQNVISSSSYSSGGAGFTIAGSSVPGNSTGTPTGWAIYSTAQSTKDANGNAFSAIAEFGGSINLNGYQLANLGVAKLYYTTNGANFMSSTPGLTSFTCPKMGTATSYQIMVTGAGGGQGGHGGATSVYGGSAGGAGCILITVSPGDVLSILVGAGSAGVNSGSAASGGTSSVSKGASGTPAVSVSFYGGSTTSGGNISATGAVSLYAGAVASMTSPAVGYFGGNPLWLYSGATGGVGNTAGGSCGIYPGGAANSSSGGGGASPWGPGGAATNGSTGGTPTAFGAGGGGGYTSYGGNGGPGMIMLQII